MRTILLVTLILAVGHHVSAAVTRSGRTVRTDGNMNEYFDTLVVEIGHFFSNNGLDPLPIPNQERTFSVKDLLGITWHGELGLEDITVTGLSMMHRSGNATIAYKNELLHIQVELGFDSAQLNTKFVAQIMNIGPKGNVVGKIKNMKLFLDIIADLETLEIYLQDLKITDAGKIDAKITGQGLLDLLINPIADAITLIFHDVITVIVSQTVKSVVEKALDDIDVSCMITDCTAS